MPNKSDLGTDYYHVLFYCKANREGNIRTYTSPQEVYARVQKIKAAYSTPMPWSYLDFCDEVYVKGKGGFALASPNYYILIDMSGKPFPSIKGMQYH